MATKSIVIIAALIAVTSVCPMEARADSYDAGLRAMMAGNIQQALLKFQRSTRPEAKYQIAELAYQGKIGNCDRPCSVNWFVEAARQGVILAYYRLGNFAFNSDNREKAVEYFTICARWNMGICQTALRELGVTVPPADLLAEQQRATRQAEIAEREQKIKTQQEALAYFSGQWGFGQPAQVPPGLAASSSSTPQLPSLSASPSRSRELLSSGLLLCPNGSYVYGDGCHMAPDGSYLGGAPRIAPDGSYVAGSPRIAPNGRYVGGSGQIIICPDGSYVAGSFCEITPNGHYVGRP